MAGISCYSPLLLSSRSILGSSLLVLKGKTLRRAFLIKEQVEFVNVDKAKKLVALEGYAVLDVCDKTQFERAHIKNCYHVPLFVENTDNDLGTIVKRQLQQQFCWSAAAAQRLEGAGYDNITCITFGFQFIKPGTFDSVGLKEMQDDGKAGLVTIQGKISTVLGVVLICALLFVTFFPDQAEQLLQMAPLS
ncbi:hypothetical protein CQW23_10146 [Capsicum baccatum]|uniref:Rhodanese-like domain-containing protein 9, chloroplastic n=1 Tax=Capsicum baccatum TaxID=33114 RepID=A0A2G2WYZ7_CAPBA|nr:hypothetical protein CQW23_10146 [Capsicum baccatum]